MLPTARCLRFKDGYDTRHRHASGREREKAEIRRKQLVIVGLMALVIIALLVGMLIYRHQKESPIEGAVPAIAGSPSQY